MKYYTYIIISEKTGRLYIGQTQHFDKRLEEHNAGKSKSTRNKDPWSLLFLKEFSSRREAVELENKLKRRKNKDRILTWIEKLKEIKG